MKKEIENLKDYNKFKQDLIKLILEANNENLEKLRKAYPELVEEFRK